MVRTTKRMAALALSAALVFPAAAGTATIGFAGYKGADTLTDFPALIKLPDCAAGFSYVDAAADGADIYFTDSDGNVIPHDVDTWNASGASYVWVKVPALTAAATVTMHWGETLPANVPAASDTWTGYVGVWHMNAADGATATPEPDATGHGLNAMPVRNTKLENILSELQGIPNGKVGAARRNQSSGGKCNGLKTPNYASKITDCSKMTVGGWFRATQPNGWMRLFSAKSDNGNTYGFEAFTLNNSFTSFGASGSSGYATTSDTTLPSVQQDWIHVQLVYDGTTAKYYANGTIVKSFSVTAIKASSSALYLAIGNNKEPNEAAWRGCYDEVRMYDGVMSADRIQAEYDTANNPVAFVKGHTADFYCAGYDGDETLADFPICVHIPDCVPNFRYEDAAADGSDIWFSDASGNVLASEKDVWKRSNYDGVTRSSFWVKVPSMTGETRITMHWGGTPPAGRPAATEVWTGYAGVWHMGTANGEAGTPEPDATGHGLSAMPTSTVPSHVSQLKPRNSGDTCLIGNCCQNQTDTGKNGLFVPSPEAHMTDTAKMSIGGWFFADNANGYMRLFSAKAQNGQNGGWEVWANNGHTKRYGVTGGSGSNVFPAADTHDCKNRWVHFMAVYNGTNVKLYVNGEKYIDGTVGAISARAADSASGDVGGYSFMIGGMPRLNDSSWRGCYDEVRLYDGAMSAARVRALYLAESYPAAFLRTKPRSAGGIVQERPYYGMDFVRHLRTDLHFVVASGTPKTSLGTGYLTGFGEQVLPMLAVVGFDTIPSLGGTAMTTARDATSVNIAGQGFNFGSGDWTYHVRARTGDVTNGVVWCLGGGGYTMASAANGPDGVSLVILQNNVATPLARLDVPVLHASVSYHDYAAVFHVSGKTVDFYVDGVFKDSVSYANFTASDDRWKFFGLWNANVNFTYTKDARIEDVRFYRRALTAGEIATLHGWLSFSAPARTVYSATAAADCPFSDLAWSPMPPEGGFGADDVLDVTVASGCTLAMPTNVMPSVAGLVMRGGTLKMGGKDSTGPKWLRLADGASLDENGYAQALAAYPRIVLDEGAYLRNDGAHLNNNNAQFPRGVELAPGATAYLHTSGQMGLIGDYWAKTFTDLNGGTLVKTGSGTCYMANIVFGGGGTLEMREGAVETFTVNGYATALTLGKTEIEVKNGATFTSGVSGEVGTIRGDGAVDSTVGTLTVGSILSGRVTVGGTTNTVLASGATLDLSANTAPFVQPATMTFAGAVNVALPSGAAARGKLKLISWDAPPAEGVTFAAVGELPRNMKLDVRDDGLYLYRAGLVIIVK